MVHQLDIDSQDDIMPSAGPSAPEFTPPPPNQYTSDHPGREDQSQFPTPDLNMHIRGLTPVQRDSDDEEDLREDSEPPVEREPVLRELKDSKFFIDALKSAKLADSGLSKNEIHRLRNPPQTDASDELNPLLELAINIFLATSNAAEATYTAVREALILYDPEIVISSHAVAKQRIADITGVLPQNTDMCTNTCLAFTGPYSGHETCKECGEARYDDKKSTEKKKVARRQFMTIPIGPQIQALFRSPESAERMRYRINLTTKLMQAIPGNTQTPEYYEDFFHGSEYLKAVRDGVINDSNLLLMFSIDGAQLYASKQSDCWIAIWVILDLAPDHRYQKVRVYPACFIGGPNKPKLWESFAHVSLYHLAALQNEQLTVWDASTRQLKQMDLVFALGTGDGPAMQLLGGGVGHGGALGCRKSGCTMPGRRKEGASMYFPVALRPLDYDVANSCHDDVDIRQPPHSSPGDYEANIRALMACPNLARYKEKRLETGIARPCIISGLPRGIGVPQCFPLDIMHLISLNIPDLIINLWRGLLHCDKSDDKETWDWAVLKGEVWRRHGALVAATTAYLPGSFDRPPRNPAEKISSGYKAREFLLYLFCLGPAIFRITLPNKYWKHFCKLVFGVRIVHQRKIFKRSLILAHIALVTFAEEFELLYYQRRADRIHFVRQSIHLLIHLAPEILRCGPLGIYGQSTLERTIGNTTEEIRQHSNPFANLSARGLLRCQTNALYAAIPSLLHSKAPAQNSILLGDKYVLLHPTARYQSSWQSEKECDALASFLTSAGAELEDFNLASLKIRKWGRLSIPTGQIARSAWKEKEQKVARMSRNVTIHVSTQMFPCVAAPGLLLMMFNRQTRMVIWIHSMLQRSNISFDCNILVPKIPSQWCHYIPHPTCSF